MQYLDIVLGQEYVYQGHPVTVIGTRVITHVGAGHDEYSVTILDDRQARLVVKPHELSSIATSKEPSVPDRLASQIVMQLMETLAEHNLLVLGAVDDDAAITTMNNATDAAIEEVERLLQQD